jgi:hypothetical protein
MTTLKIIDKRQTARVAGTSGTLSVVKLVAPGPQGPPGGGATTYTHIQSSASALWTVAHNLGVKPIVTITTVGGVEVMGGEVVHLSNNTLTIAFNTSFAGEARCI